jgi:hypothetical protein
VKLIQHGCRPSWKTFGEGLRINFILSPLSKGTLWESRREAVGEGGEGNNRERDNETRCKEEEQYSVDR